MRKKLLRRKLALLLAVVTLACSGKISAAESQFNGGWAYEQTCGSEHVASVQFSQKGNQVSGKWSDGSTRGSGTSGQLKGRINDGKLFVRYCGIDEDSDSNICPNYDAEESDYFVRQGSDMIWYKESGNGKGISFEKYLILHPKLNGKITLKDGACDK